MSPREIMGWLGFFNQHFVYHQNNNEPKFWDSYLKI